MFKIVLTENNRKISVLHIFKRERDANNKFQKLKSQAVLFPKTKSYKGKKLEDIRYEIVLLKKKEEIDENKFIKNELGKFVEMVTDDPEWVVVDFAVYNMEETFSVVNVNRKLTAKEIIDNLVIVRKEKKNPKQVLILKNKIIIESLELFLVICKNSEQALKLYNKIRLYCYDNKISDILFFGIVDKISSRVWYKTLHKRLKINYNRLYRSSSR
jgi:hypothetical protein